MDAVRRAIDLSYGVAGTCDRCGENRKHLQDSFAGASVTVDFIAPSHPGLRGDDALVVGENDRAVLCGPCFGKLEGATLRLVVGVEPRGPRVLWRGVLWRGILLHFFRDGEAPPPSAEGGEKAGAT